MLLSLLLSVYLGGRYILVQMIRQTEENIRVIGSDIKRMVFDELHRLQRLTADEAARFARVGPALTDELLREQLGLKSRGSAIDMAVLLAHDGRLIRGYARFPETPLREVAAADLQPYLATNSPLHEALRREQLQPGILVCGAQPFFYALAPLPGAEGGSQGVLMLGSHIQSAFFLKRVSEATPGLQVSLVRARIAREAGQAGRADGRRAGGVQELLTYAAGGNWHLGSNAFEAEIPVADILGNTVTAITIRLPGSFSAVASVALGWLTCFIACVGIVFVLPMFWFQSRILLNPLSRLTAQIQEIGEHHLDGQCPAIAWPHHDEFGVLAMSVNEMVAALARKTRQNEQSEQSQRALIAGMPDGLCVFNSQAQLVSVRKQPDYAHPIPGLVMGLPVSPPIFPASDCEAFRQAMGVAFRTDRIQMMMLACREADGSYRHFETRISRMDDVLAVVVLRDVTKEWRERAAREHVEAHLAKVQKMESLGTLAAGIAHDFNNILAIIQNTVELNWELPGHGELEALGTIRQATDKGAALTRELMTYAGNTRTAFKRQDPNAMILELKTLMGGVVAQNVILDFRLAPGLPPVDADPHQFWKVLINLLKNASEAFEGAGGRITISTGLLTLTQQSAADFFSSRPLPLENGVLFQVEDSGPGIPPEVITRLFEPFVSTKAVGRGLGLATVFGIVDVHSGGIAITSEPDQGTCFRIWLPTAKAADGAATASAVPSAGARAVGVGTESSGARDTARGAVASGPLVLLVEDDPAILRTTRIVLRSLGVDALTAASQREAQTLFSQHADALRLLLLDAQAGSLDNVRLLSILRLRRPDIPTVILSGHPEEQIREMFANEHYDAFLGKPYTRDELRATLQRFIEPA